MGDETQLPAQALPMPRMRQSKLEHPLVHRILAQPPPHLRWEQLDMACGTLTISDLSWDCLLWDAHHKIVVAASASIAL